MSMKELANGHCCSARRVTKYSRVFARESVNGPPIVVFPTLLIDTRTSRCRQDVDHDENVL